MSEYIAYSGAENPLLLKLDLSIISHCNFHLNKYPWDVQECRVELRVSETTVRGATAITAYGLKKMRIGLLLILGHQNVIIALFSITFGHLRMQNMVCYSIMNTFQRIIYPKYQ